MEKTSLTVLIVEDNADHLELIRRAFGFASDADRLFSCTTLQEAQRWLQAHQPDVIVADLRLPDGEGLELLAHSAVKDKIPVVILTNQGDERYAVQALRLGALEYLVKSAETFWRIPAVAHRVWQQWRLSEAKREAEEKLRQHELLLSSILQSMRDGYILLDAEGRVLEVNRAYADLVGYAPQELLGRALVELEAETAAQQMAAVFETVRRQGSALLVTAHRHRCGKQIEVEISLTHLPDHEGKMVAFVRDIRQRIAMRTALQEAQKHIERQREEMTILRNIDLAIAVHRERRTIVQALTEQIMQLRGVLGVWLLARGSPESDHRWTLQAALPGESACLLVQLPPWLEQALEWVSTHKQSYLAQLDSLTAGTLPAPLTSCAALVALPLLPSDQVLMVLVIFGATPELVEAEWRPFLEAMAAQTTIALENARLYEALSANHRELLEAYQATLEAWSRTLEIRDRETQGHTQRVVEIGLKLARACGLSERDMEVFRRGAMLHDIGKLRIPDSILMKPSALNEQEWEVMRQHPLYAREIVQGIRILEEALEIPLYHHERWDGTGYPFGLKGEAIPLSARIFAVADVWDALTSDRPYRPAWTREAARAYIQTQANAQFDPKVVEVFLRLLDAGAIP